MRRKIINGIITDFEALQHADEHLRKELFKGLKVSRFYDDTIISADSLKPVTYTIQQWTELLRKMGFKIPKPRHDFRIRIVNHYIQMKAKENYDKREL